MDSACGDVGERSECAAPNSREIYGVQLACNTTDTGQTVEAARMNRTDRHGIDKVCSLDTRTIATAVLALQTEQLRIPRQDDGVRAAKQIPSLPRRTRQRAHADPTQSLQPTGTAVRPHMGAGSTSRPQHSQTPRRAVPALSPAAYVERNWRASS